MTEFHGTDRERFDLLEALRHNCLLCHTSDGALIDGRENCGHGLMEMNQSQLDHLVFARRLGAQGRINEGDPA